MLHRVAELTGVDAASIERRIREYLGPEYLVGPDAMSLLIDRAHQVVRDTIQRFINHQEEANEFTHAPWELVDEPYGDDMPGMTLDEFQAWSDQIINEVKGDG